MQPNTDNFHKFIRAYLLPNRKLSQVVEKFRYNLVISNLLDDSLVLSKNEQALNNLIQIRNSIDGPMHARLTKQFNFDGTELYITNKQYRLVVPKVYSDPLVLLRTLCLIVFLMKQNVSVTSNVRHSSRIKLFRILLIVSTRLMKFKRAIAIIGASRSLRSLDDFMISNCKVNRALITNMITIKEYEMFIFLNKAESEGNPAYSKNLKSHLNTVLTCLTLNIRHSISGLLPCSNGEILEKYCQINNVQLGPIFTGSDSTEGDDITLDSLTARLNHFNNLRRFFICQLLTVHDGPLQNFFILKLYDSFNLSPDTSSCDSSERLRILERVFSEHTSAIDQIMALNEKFRGLNNPAPTTDYANDNVLTKSSYGLEKKDDLFAPEAELSLSNLINKLENLTTSLKYFKKYSQSISTVNDAEEYDEKLSIFDLFHVELQSTVELYKACMGEYRSEYSNKFEATPSSHSNSQRNSHNSNDCFSLKSFHTSSSAKKRLSPLQNEQELRNKLNDRKSKRFSTGLQLGLLTVVEESKKDHIPFENGNVLPSNHNSFNQSALDALTRKIGIKNPNHRFSVNSLNSNISGISELIASTQITTDEDETDRNKPNTGALGMSKEDLKKKLEESFSRIYCLESENQELKIQTIEKHTIKEELPNESDTATKNFDFVSELEKTLGKGPNNLETDTSENCYE